MKKSPSYVLPLVCSFNKLIKAPVQGLQRVTLNKNLFNAYISSKDTKYNGIPPVLKITTQADSAGNGSYSFTLDNVLIIARYEKDWESIPGEKGPNMFWASEADALSHHVPHESEYTEAAPIVYDLAAFARATS